SAKPGGETAIHRSAPSRRARRGCVRFHTWSESITGESRGSATGSRSHEGSGWKYRRTVNERIKKTGASSPTTRAYTSAPTAELSPIASVHLRPEAASRVRE